MFETVKRLYRKTDSKTVVRAAVSKGWITEDQYEAITGGSLEA